MNWRDSIFSTFCFRNYLGHFISSPHSLLVKILGAFSLRYQSGQKNRMVCESCFTTLCCLFIILNAVFFLLQRHFIVMQSIFWPSSGITQKFDIKGCLGGRYQDPNTMKEHFVLKDKNFLNTPLNLGQHKTW